MIKSIYLYAFLAISFFACNENKTSDERTETAKVPESWVADRVKKSQEKLEATDAGKIVWQAMEAHGGLANWHKKGPISFRFNYQPLDGNTGRDTREAVDTWRSRTVHFSKEDSTYRFGWDGEKAWAVEKDSTTFGYNTRFWALTPYFFMAQPFVLDGDGVNLELLVPIEFNDKMNDVVKVTFAKGTGDAPDDYYVLYFGQEDHKLKVIRYIVSYPGYFKDGGHMPEKMMELVGEQNVDGFIFPNEYKTYWLTEDQQPGEYITKIELSEINFRPDLPMTFFDIPKGAKISETL